MDRRLLRALLLFPLVGCERVVGVTLPATQTRLVVEARLERPRDVTATGRQEVHLTTTDSYFSKTTPPAVRGATVRVADDSGRVVAFTESTTRPGWYETNGLIISVGRKYTLRITWLGDEYVSTETALPSVAIDSLYFSKRTGDVGPVDGLRATISLQDPEGVRNFYLWDQFIDGRRLVSFDSLSFTRAVTSDDIFDGGQFRSVQPYDGYAVKSGQLVTLRQVSISEQAYQFYFALSTQAEADGSPFGTKPASVRGNVANLTTVSKLALGYFIVSEVAERQRRVP